MELITLALKDANDCSELDEISLNGLWSKQQWEEELSNSNRLCFGIFISSKLVALACGWLVVGELQLTVVAVHPEHRREGLARLVLLRLLKQARFLSATEATLEVDSNNFAATSLYKSCGFITTGERPNYYKNGSDALIQWRSLAQ